jgi:glycine/D-amino acid oxidase-like deaminating enzyme
MPKIHHLPVQDRSNGWSRMLPARTTTPRLSGNIRADWLVVGAGFAGLAAARRLAANRPDDAIVILDAGEVGENASGRNSGFAIDVPHTVSASLQELDGSRRYMRLARAAIAHLKSVVRAHDIACAWSQAGKYQAAVSARGSGEMLEPFARELEGLGEPHRWLNKTELEREIGTPYHHSAVYTPGCVLMNPAALTRGLAATLPGTIALYENSPVVEIAYENGIRASTPGGAVLAPKMILAVNGFAPAFGFLRRRLLPFHAHASLTRPLSDDEHRALGGVGEWGLTPANAFVSVTMRYTQDRRILIRHDINYCPSQTMRRERQLAACAVHQELFRRRFPMLPDVEIEHTWTGFVCLSRNYAPGFGRVAANVWAAVCQNAVGVTKGTISGLLAADMACGIDNELIADMESLGTPAPLPPRPFLDAGVHVRTRWDLWRARHEA